MSTKIDLDFRPKSYFAGRKVEKVEIARITVNSVCLDSATLRAWPRQRGIQYQVSDGYDGQLLDGEDHTESDRPMSLGELADFLLSTWPLMKFLEMNYKDDLERALKFFWAESAFYPDLDRLCRGGRVQRHERFQCHHERRRRARRFEDGQQLRDEGFARVAVDGEVHGIDDVHGGRP